MDDKADRQVVNHTALSFSLKTHTHTHTLNNPAGRFPSACVCLQRNAPTVAVLVPDSTGRVSVFP